ncbi:MAG TPA: type II 3-dehydroquinate dehydratase [Bacteroidetes bacterium]|nr:type II 3-dehydroquinate dehydratase [Bacteroidota bacterium]
MKIQIINGPNLNLLGKRQPEIYGKAGFEEYLKILRDLFKDITIDYFQSNVEGEIVTKIQETGFSFDGIILNAAGYTHTSVSIADAVAAVPAPVVEVHISNILKREEFRHKSLLAPVCVGTITGFGLDSYRLGIEALRVILSSNK